LVRYNITLLQIKQQVGLNKQLLQLMDLSSPFKLYTYNNDNKSSTYTNIYNI